MGHGMVYMRVGHHKVVKLMTGGQPGGRSRAWGAAAPCPPPGSADGVMVIHKHNKTFLRLLSCFYSI